MPTHFLTGANRGIGLELVRQLSSPSSPAKPNTIIAAVRTTSNASTTDLSELTSLSKTTKSETSTIHIIECDVSSQESLSTLPSRVAEILSKKSESAKLDFIWNVSGINATSSDTSLTLSYSSLERHMATNVFGPAKIVESLEPYLAYGARIVNMSSGLGSLAVATGMTKCCTYSMSKAALNMLTLHQSRDLNVSLKGEEKSVVVVAMDPGWVKTRMGGSGAMIEAEESVGGMLEVVEGLKQGDSGKFYKYDGGIVPW